MGTIEDGVDVGATNDDDDDHADGFEGFLDEGSDEGCGQSVRRIKVAE